MAKFGTNVFHCWNFLTITATNLARRWPPFEALYGRRCRISLNWSQAGEREIFGPDLVLKAEDKVKVIKKNLEASQVRQKSYHDKWGIMCTSRSHTQKVFRDLGLREN
jgi:hypothetical protein